MIKLLICLFAFTLYGCNPLGGEKAKVDFKNPQKSTDISVSNVQIISNQIVLSGTNLDAVTDFKIQNGGTTTVLQIESKTNSSLIANTLANFNFASDALFDFILSNASASSTFQVTFSVGNNTITAAMLSSMGATKGQILKYTGSAWVPSSITNAQFYLGTWDASTNSPNLTIPSSNPGDYYIVSAAGTFESVTYAVGDWIISDGYNWQKVGNSSVVVSSLNGRRGAVTLVPADYSYLKDSGTGKITGALLNDFPLFNISTTPANGDVIKYDSGTSKWISGAVSGGAGTVTSVTGTAPVVVTGTTTPVVSMAAATSSVNGYLSSADWSTFNGKQSSLSNSAGLLAALSDETGTGFSVFSASPTFTGIPLAPTAATNTSTTQIATTAFVMGQAALLSPAVGSSSVTTLGTISSGVWNGTAIAVANGGTGATTPTIARSNLGLGSAAVANTGNNMGQLPILGANASVGSMCTFDLTLGFICNTAIPTANANTANPLSQFASTTSAQLAGVLSDETGSGAAVFGTAPTLSSPVISNIDTGSNFTLTQNSVTPIVSENSGAVANTLYLKSGNVGLGTATPSMQLDVSGNARVGLAPTTLTTTSTSHTTTDTTISVASTTGYPSTGVLFIPSTGELMTYTGVSGTAFTGVTRGRYATTAATIASAATVDVWMFGVSRSSTTAPRVIFSASNGSAIGAAPPSWLGNNGLYIAGNFFAQGSIVSNNSYNFGSSSVVMTGYSVSNSTDYWHLKTNSLERLRVDGSGKVGIGTSGPTEMLDVAGNVRATSFISTSDQRLKKDIKKTSGLDVVLNLTGVQWNWKSNNLSDAGVIAQSVEKIYPVAVVTDSKSGIKSVKYNTLLAPVIESIKEIWMRISSNKNEIEKLKQENLELRYQNEQMREDLDLIKSKLNLK